MPPAILRWTDPESLRRETLDLSDLKDRLLIGRADGMTVRVKDPRMSRQHAMLSRADGIWVVSDVKSALGTHYQRGGQAWKRLDGELALRDGDKLRLGRTVIEFLDPPASGPVSDGGGSYTAGPDFALTPREQEMLEAYCEPAFVGGSRLPTDKQLAEHFGLAPTTIKTHMQNLMDKFGVKDRALLVTRAIEGGWVRDPRDRER